MSDSLNVILTGQALIRGDLLRDDPASVADMAAYFAGADVCFSNFEGTVLGRHGGEPTKPTAKGAPPASLDALRRMGVNVLALANNHAFDLGLGGIRSTLEEAGQRGFILAGAGLDLTEATKPGLGQAGRCRCAMVAMDLGPHSEGAYAADTPQPRPGINPQRIVTGPDGPQPDAAYAERNLAAIAAAKREAELVLVYLHNHHWLPDWQQTPEWVRRFSRRCLDAGGHLVVAHGTPVPQGIELCDGRLIFHGLGNFVFHSQHIPYWVERSGARSWRGVVVRLDLVGGRFAGLELRPISMVRDEAALMADRREVRDGPCFDDGELGRATLEELVRLSAKLGTTLVLDDDRAVLG